MIQLDTSFLIRALIPRAPEDLSLRGWLRSEEAIEVSSVAWAEFLCGPLDPVQLELAKRIVTEVRSFDAPSAGLAAELFNEGGRRRGSLIDCMIAATAILTGARLATLNIADYRRFLDHGLQLLP